MSINLCNFFLMSQHPEIIHINVSKNFPNELSYWTYTHYLKLRLIDNDSSN
jgi:hypothetical protein